MIRIILIYFLIFPIEINGIRRRRCMNTGILFLDTIARSPIVVYGKSLAKQIDIETDKEILFNITFRVDCIFKGQYIENRIEIIKAGIKTGLIACQYLDPGKFYVVFLEKCTSNMNIYCPLDFQERIVDDLTLELLERTCHLKRISPLNSISNKCPNVSIDKFCPNDYINIKIKPRGKLYDLLNTNMQSIFNNDNQFYHQSNVTLVKDRLLINQYVDNPRNYARLSTLTSVWIIYLIVNILMFN
ncbi:unnamed protein product [Rotaria sordida]|uniref:Uncharacterized protein n=1 Tax=Rotaria sordida TaxID=392033 RepID=A0A819YME3_9BILA|nr:unnamed protein product [Rotaria sordida]CAF3844625.1 unnamed protein product [Rotaria sordida]CAF4159927.1 unnamed protein product [Rotaria sordida]